MRADQAAPLVFAAWADELTRGILGKLGFIERRGEIIVEGPLLDLLMDTDLLKERIINGALADVFKRAPAQVVHIPREVLAEAAAAIDNAAAVEDDAAPTDTPNEG